MNSLVALLEWLVAQLKSSEDKERRVQDANLADHVKKAEEEHQKQQLAHYAATVTAWFSTKMEHDKSLLTLSSAAIGVLVTLVSKFPIQSYAAMSLFVAALACFIICVIAVLAIGAAPI